jgi:ATP-dependent DNA helicase RecG
LSADFFSSPISSLPGLGAKTAGNLAKLNLHTLWDLLLHLPLRYEDRTKIIPIGQITPGMTALVTGTIEFTDVLPRGRRSLICRISDGTGFIDLRFFNFHARQAEQFQAGRRMICYGEIRHGYNGLEIAHPDYHLDNGTNPTEASDALTPVYPLGQGLTQNMVRKAVTQALSVFNRHADALPEYLPDAMTVPLNLPGFAQALNQLHTPIPGGLLQENQEKALARLALEELLAHHLSIKAVKQKTKSWQAATFIHDPAKADQLQTAMAFQPTKAQTRVMTEIAADCGTGKPMTRLIQGDVGSGKTVVAAYAALIALAAGYQVVVMAPTELLAEQHHRNFSRWFETFGTPVFLLTGQQKGKIRHEILNALDQHAASITIGTHALFQETVAFAKLGLVIIDEQHRFGVHQRLALRSKGEQDAFRPHQLIMTATPIPRTLAMLNYADLDISIIDELPPGRKAVTTSVIPSERREEVIARISTWIAANKQVYWVCTLIEESELLQCEAAKNTAARLSAALPQIRVGLLHGRLKAAEKEQIMQAFKSGEIGLLVATIVIEVGVDVPNASLMIIENPERLGLSQLHQLRGRVGRGREQSYCLLLYQAPLSENARQRLGILKDSQDGFVIAEKDLQLRGPGEILGTRQTGQVNFKIADLSRDTALLDNIAHFAETMEKQVPENIPHLIDRWLGRHTHYFEV